MGFFDAFPAPDPPPPEPYRRSRSWVGPGRNVRPTTLTVDGMLTRRPEFAVFAQGFRVYPSGFEFDIVVLRQPLRPEEERDIRTENPFGRRYRPGRSEAEAGQDLRLGVQFADGRSAATGPAFAPLRNQGPRPEQPAVNMRGGHGGTGRWQQTLWVWGLPDEGDVSVVCAWPAEDVPESRLELDGDALREAAGRAVVLWEEPEDDDADEENSDVAS